MIYKLKIYRKKIAEYNEIFYLVYILSVFGLMSIGQGSDYLIYRIVFPFAFIALCVKLVSTDYTKKELFWMFLSGGLLILNMFLNGEKTLVLSMMAVLGAKNVHLNRVMKYALWERIVLTTGMILLSVAGIIENLEFSGMPKFMDGEWKGFTIYAYGYTHPNHAYIDIFSIAILFIIVYGSRMKWYGYLALHAMMYAAYYFLICRTGWYTWLACLSMLILYELIKRTKVRSFYLYLISLIPIGLTVFSVWGVFLYHVNGDQWGTLMYRINQLFTGRFHLAQECWPDLFKVVIGHIPRAGKDLAYIHFIYNYGWIIFLMLIVAYIGTMWELIKCGQDYICIALAVMSGYLLGEVTPLNVGWNITLIYVSMVIFKDNIFLLKNGNEHEGQYKEKLSV